MKSKLNACGILRILLLVITASILLPNFGHAQSIGYLPINSRASLKTYAISAARNGYTQLWGQKIITQTGDVTSFTVNDKKNADEVIAALSSAANVFRTRVTDPAAYLYAYGEIRNEDGDTLFAGNGTDQIMLQDNGQGKKKITGGKLNFRLAQDIPFKIEGVQSAIIQYEGTDGNQWQAEVIVHNGKLYFPTEYAGTKSTLVADTYTTTGGYKQIAWNVSTGEPIPGTQIEGAIASAIENHLTGSDKGLYNGSPLLLTGYMTGPTNNQWEAVSSPSVTFTVTTAPGNQRICTAGFMIKTTKEVKITEAIAMHVRADGTVEQKTPSSVTVATVGTDKAVTVTWYLNNDEGLADGSDWTATLNIPAYEAQQPPQSPYYYGGGKG